jgi:hypothetical protein
VEARQSPVHVCRRWRSLVFRSPCPSRLNLRLFCTPKTPARGTLEVRPALPLIVWGRMALSCTDNVITGANTASNRVCQVFLNHASWQSETLPGTGSVSRFVLGSWICPTSAINASRCLAFYFRDCPNYFGLLHILSPFGSLIFLIPGTFHPNG